MPRVGGRSEDPRENQRYSKSGESYPEVGQRGASHSHPDRYIAAARAKAARGDLDGAWDACMAGLDRYPRDAPLELEAGRVALRIGDVGCAERHLLRAQSLDPDLAGVRTELAKIAGPRDRFEGPPTKPAAKKDDNDGLRRDMEAGKGFENSVWWKVAKVIIFVVFLPFSLMYLALSDRVEREMKDPKLKAAGDKWQRDMEYGFSLRQQGQL